MKTRVHQWLFTQVKVVLCLLAGFFILTVVLYCNRDWAFSEHITGYFEFWQQPFGALSTVFIAYTAWVALGYVIQQQRDSRKTRANCCWSRWTLQGAYA